jgi:hypothetical protein
VQQPQQHSFQPRQQHYQPTQDANVDRLPSFITGGQSPQQNSPQQVPQQGPAGNTSNGPNGPNGQNGYDGQADRFPLHRRRRRHRGPRDQNVDNSMSGESDAPGQSGPDSNLDD